MCAMKSPAQPVDQGTPRTRLKWLIFGLIGAIVLLVCGSALRPIPEAIPVATLIVPSAEDAAAPSHPTAAGNVSANKSSAPPVPTPSNASTSTPDETVSDTSPPTTAAPTSTPVATQRPRNCAGRGHRVWLRAGESDPESVASAATGAAHRLLNAFVHDYLGSGQRGRANLGSPYFTAVGSDDVLVTDSCGRGSEGGRFDVIITFVDGEAPGFVELCKKYFSAQFPDLPFDYQRFRSNGELEFAVRSFLRHTSHMVRRLVFLVQHEDHMKRWLTNQTRALAAQGDVELVVVRHDQAFPDPSVLPVFNSIAIETVLHRVPGLSPLFMYSNDDLMIGRRMSWFDLVRPSLVELPPGYTPGALLDGTGLVRLPMRPGAHAVSVMTRPGRGGGNVTVYVEAEIMPYVEYGYVQPFINYDAEAAATVDLSTINPEVAKQCGPLKLTPSGVERKYVEKGIKRTYIHDRLMRHNREYVWNYLGVFQTHHDAHVPRFFDRALPALILDGAEDGSQGALLPPDLVNRTRASRFRDHDTAGTSQLGTCGTLAENRRRHAQLLDVNGAEWAIEREMICTDCLDHPHNANCTNLISDVGRRVPLRYPGYFQLGEFTKGKLFSPLVQVDKSPEYEFRGVGNLREIRALERAVKARRRLWFGVNDHFNPDSRQISKELMSALEGMFRSAIGE